MSKKVTSVSQPVKALIRDNLEKKKLQPMKRSKNFQRSDCDEGASGYFGEFLFSMDLEGHFTYIDPVIEKITGYNKDQVIGKSIKQLIHPDDFTGFKSSIKHTLSGRPEPYEFKILSIEGKIMSLRMINRLIEEDGKPVGITGFMLEISELEKARQIFLETDTKFHTLVGQIQAVVYSKTIDEREGTLSISPQIETLSGYQPAEWINDPLLWRNIIHPDDRERVWSEYLEVKQSKLRFLSEYRLIARNGSEVWVRDEAVILRNSKGEPLFWQGVILDITDKKKAGEVLHQRAEELNALQMNVLDLAVEQDMDSLLRSIVERSMKLLKAPKGFIYLYRETTNDLELIIELGFPVSPGLRLKLGEGMAGWVAQNRQSLIVDDYSKWEGRPSIFNNLPYHAVMEVPMLFGGQLIGVLGVNDSEEIKCKFTESDVQLLLLFAGQAASVVHDSQLVQGLKLELIERKRAEDSLRETEARHRTLVEQIPAIVYTDSAEQIGHTHYISPQIKKILGYDPEQWSVNNELWSQAIHPEDRERILKEYNRTYKIGEPFSAEYRMTSNAGQIVWVRDEAVLIRNQSGHPLFWQGIMLDITERKKAELALEESEERYRRLFDLSPDAIAVHAGGKILLANRAAMNLVGALSPEAIIGKPLMDFVHPDFRQLVLERTQLQIGEGKTSPVTEEKYVHLNGCAIDVEVTAAPIHFQDSLASLVIFRDITERKQAQALQEAIYRIAIATETTRSLKDLFPQIHEIISSVMPSENFYITLYDEERNVLRFPYFKDAQDEPYLNEIQPGQGLTAYVLRTGKSLLCTQAVHDELESQGAVKLLGVPSAIWLGVPLVIQGKTIGVMVVQHYSNPNAYGERDQHMLEFVSTQVAIAISRKQADDALKRQLQELTIIHSVSLIAAKASSVDQLISQVTQIIGDAVYVDDFGVALFDQEHQVLMPHSSYHGESFEAKARIPLSEGIMGHVASTRQIYCATNVHNDPYYLNTVPDTLSELCVPIKVGEKLIGVINAESRQVDFFSKDDERLLNTIAGTIATAIEKMRLFDAEHIRRQEAETLRQVAQVVSASLEVNEVIQRMLDQLKHLFTFDMASVLLLGESSQPDLIAGRDANGKATNQAVINLPKHSLILRKLKKDLKALAIIDVREYPGWVVVPGTEYIRSFLAVPLITRQHMIGVLMAASATPSFFSENEVRVTQLLAQQMAIAIENARLYEVEQRRLAESETLREAAAVVASTLDQDRAVQLILDQLARVVPYDSASILLMRDGYFEIIGGKGWSDPSVVIGLHIPFPGDNPNTKVVQQRSPVILGNAPQQYAIFTQEPHVKILSWLGAPMIVRDKVMGILAIDSRQPDHFNSESVRLVSAFANQAATTIENARLYEEAIQAAERRAILHRVSQEIVHSSQDLEQVYAAVQRAATQLMPTEAFVITLLDEKNNETIGVYLEDKSGRHQVDRAPAGVGLSGLVISSGMPVITNDLQVNPIPGSIHFGKDDEEVRSLLAVPLRLGEKVMGMLSVQSYQPYAYNEDDQTLLEMLAAHTAVAIENGRLYAETLQKIRELEAINHISTALRSAQTVDDMLPSLLDETLKILECNSGVIWLFDPAGGVLKERVTRGWFKAIQETPVKPGEGIAGIVYQTGEVIVSKEFASDPRTRESTRNLIPGGWGGACVPIRAMHETIGVLFVSVELPRQIQEGAVSLLVTLTEMAGNAIRRATLHEQTERQLQRLASLRAVDLAINTILDLRVTLGILIDHIISQLEVDAVNILLINPNTQSLYHAASAGFRSDIFKSTRLYIGDSLAGQAIRTRTTIQIPNLSESNLIQRAHLLNEEGFVTYFGVPLIAKGQIKGVLETFHRYPMQPDLEWRNFLETLAGQAAIAIDNSVLFEELQQTNLGLSLAYDATIEGWSKALDMRDQETEGHTQRVTELTIQLADIMGIPPTDLVHIRRGALLHDIGKMGVPDNILHKAGPLSEDEWAIMHRHPEFAFDMLSPINYLRDALDIPYGHHERWDGSGYPRHLSGIQIPLAARIFAVVDVWDALISNRPYRKAFTKVKAAEFVRKNGGILFDPQVVNAFFKLVADEKLS
jgi:PAS domain S-box-containing protein/putative nucleotidyltransferase with HDIG domain